MIIIVIIIIVIIIIIIIIMILIIATPGPEVQHPGEPPGARGAELPLALGDFEDAAYPFFESDTLLLESCFW